MKWYYIFISKILRIIIKQNIDFKYTFDRFTFEINNKISIFIY